MSNEEYRKYIREMIDQLENEDDLKKIRTGLSSEKIARPNFGRAREELITERGI